MNNAEQQDQILKTSQGLSFDEQHRRQHESDHTALLSQYAAYQVASLKYKNKYKFVFFLVCLILLALPIVFVGIIFRAVYYGWLSTESYSTLAAIITATIGASADIMILPKIMGEYFFNKEEDKNIIELFSNAQKNDQYYDKKEDSRQEILNKIISK